MPARSRRRWDDRWQRHAESVPIAVDGGLATSKQRGAMADAWWSKRFVEVLDSYGLGTRMARGRRYARRGQVLSLDVLPGEVRAEVQGSRRTPYVVTVAPAPLTPAAWAQVDAALAARVGFAARLLAGEVPPELEELFATAGAALLPRSWRDVRADCSCPDDANPCKHIAAVLYLFADRLDDDPWLVMTWRGRPRDQVLAALAPAGAAGDDGVDHGLPPWWPLDPGARGSSAVADEVLELPAGDPPDDPAAVLARLDPLDARVGDVPLVDLVAAAYPSVVRADTTPTDLSSSNGE